MKRLILVCGLLWLCGLPAVGGAAAEEADTDPTREGELLSHTRQLTFEGRRAGEGYFSRDGRWMVFQSERQPDNPFFQIYLMDLETGDVRRMSPGYGKTTCAWIHPDGDRVLFASTHEDPRARDKQSQELADRAAGKERRYAWDYDESFELYSTDTQAGELQRLTESRGYDAEGSWSPDGQWIVFASNRHAYEQPLSEERQEILERDQSFFNEIYRMRSDGSQLQRLTHTDGYDGGPFSPDGGSICWRRFSEDGALAEIMIMKADGSEPRQITRMGAMSWAPFYHPSGEYLVFTTNRHGFSNFELYLVDAQAKSPPVRVTYTDGFDGLPTFTPDGTRLAWTTNRIQAKQSQIFIADWDHQAARRKLGLPDADAAVTQAGDVAADTALAQQAAIESASTSSAGFQPQDILRHVDYLCRPELEGRLTGTRGEQMATAYAAAYLDSLGLEPAGDNGGWFQVFEFTSGISLGSDNQLTVADRSYAVDTDWRPLAFSGTGTFPDAEVVFAGYGITAPGSEEQDEYDSFVHLDVKDKWVLCFRFLPEEISPERRQHLARYSSLRFKAMKVRDLGARGLIVVSGPTSQVKRQLVPLRFDGSLSGASIPVIAVTDAVAAEWLKSAGKELEELQQQWDSGEPAMGVALPEIRIAATVDLNTVKKTGRNVLAVLPATEQPAQQTIVVGAHIDHLGRGTGGSLARDDEAEQIHFGADDNASGVAAILEIAQYLADQRSAGRFDAKRDVLFAAWSGEELGLLGASHFVNHFGGAAGVGHETLGGSAHGGAGVSSHGSAESAAETLYPRISACLNLDMVGRFEKRLVLQGVASSSVWPSEIERRNAPVGLPITTQGDSYLPTDASAFFMRGVPILSAFTGAHSEYHTPRDTPDKLNYDDAARIARFFGLVTRSLATADQPPDYVPQARPAEDRPRAGLRAYLGTIPDYAQSDVKGVKLSGVATAGPAAQAGVKGGDVIVGLAGKKVENIYDYTYAIDALKIGQAVKIVVRRGSQELTLDVTPGSRE